MQIRRADTFQAPGLAPTDRSDIIQLASSLIPFIRSKWRRWEGKERGERAAVPDPSIEERALAPLESASTHHPLLLFFHFFTLSRLDMLSLQSDRLRVLRFVKALMQIFAFFLSNRFDLLSVCNTNYPISRNRVIKYQWITLYFSFLFEYFLM